MDARLGWVCVAAAVERIAPSNRAVTPGEANDRH